MTERHQLVIMGSGPAGLSAGARAAERGLGYVVLERRERFAETIQKYQRGKFVMATPDVLPLHGDSDISFTAGSREQVLDGWGQRIAERGIGLRYGAERTRIKGQRGAFAIELKDRSEIEAAQLVLAIGVQGNLRGLDVPGAELPLVQYQLDDPDEYAGETIVVVGAGDAAIENALALAKQNRVIIVNRRSEFARAKTGNLNAIEKAIESGRIECVYDAAPERVEPGAISSAHARRHARVALRPHHRAARRRPAAPLPRSLRHRVPGRQRALPRSASPTRPTSRGCTRSARSPAIR